MTADQTADDAVTPPRARLAALLPGATFWPGGDRCVNVSFNLMPDRAAALADDLERGRAALAKIRTPEQIAEQRAKGWPDFHPEDYCHRCGHPNVRSWSVDSEVWNAVFRVHGSPDEWQWQGIVCPQCFTEIARERGVHGGSWRLRPDHVAPGAGDFVSQHADPRLIERGKRWGQS